MRQTWSLGSSVWVSQIVQAIRWFEADNSWDILEMRVQEYSWAHLAAVIHDSVESIFIHEMRVQEYSIRYGGLSPRIALTPWFFESLYQITPHPIKVNVIPNEGTLELISVFAIFEPSILVYTIFGIKLTFVPAKFGKSWISFHFAFDFSLHHIPWRNPWFRYLEHWKSWLLTWTMLPQASPNLASFFIALTAFLRKQLIPNGHKLVCW